MCSCKNEARVAIHWNYKLSRDIEINPGPPTYFDPNKTIVAPYSQGKELVFEQNAGQQCVAMSSCSLIYNDTQGISLAHDLIQIMNIENQLYSSLSQLARQAYLMQSELPTALNLFDTDYQLEYSESDWYCSLRNCYRGISVLYIFTKNLWVARIWKLHQFHINSRVYYCNSNMGFKIFDSHARDLYDGGQPQGTCILLEVLPPDSLVHYYQSIHNNDLFEARGVQIENIQNRMVSQNSLNETINFNLSCDVALYSLCYPINKIM